MIKIKPYLLLFLISLFLLSYQAIGQTPGQKAAIRSQNKVVSLNNLQQRLSSAYRINHSRALKLAQQKGWPVYKKQENGSTLYLYGIDKFNLPIYVTSANLNAAISTSTAQVQEGGESGLDLTGDGLTIGMWEVARPLLTHQEFSGRMSQADNDTSSAVDLHSTHVGGTLIASGVNPDARGMATEGIVDAYTANNDAAEMADAAAAGLLLSNHSYGYITGWFFDYFGDGRYAWFGTVEISETEDYRFGAYTEDTRIWDQIAANAPAYLIVKSAGNDRLEGPPPGAEHWFFNPEIDDWELSTAPRDLDGGPDGYDAVGEQSSAKNILAIGAVNDVLGGYTNPADVEMSSFSAWGPTDDGRIKPDIVANGVGLISSSNASNTSYSSISGTSMAAPNATGSLMLLQEHYEAQTGSFMLAATLKGLAIHAANEAGPSPGPDYSFGHGLLNTARAAQIISDNNVSAYIREETLAQGQTYTFDVDWDGSQPLAATISWTDLPADSITSDLDDPALRLINDLDIRITNNGNTYEPWILDPANPSAAATKGDNFRDNVEKILISDAAPGTYTITVTHKNTLAGGSQNFSLIISGEPEFTAPAIAVSPELIKTVLEAGETSSELLTIANHGDDTLVWNLSMEEVNNAAFAKMLESTLMAMKTGKKKDGKIPANHSVKDSKYIPGAIMTLENVVQYATDFEEFTLGELNGQQGWASTPDAYMISAENPASGAQHIRGFSNGEATNSLAFSPEVGIGTEAVSSMSARVSINGTGTTWQIIPQSPSAGSVNTRIQFGPDSTIAILDAIAGDYVLVDASVPSGYFDLTLTIHRETSAMHLYINGDLVYEGVGFAGDIEEVVLFSLREGNSTMDVDDLQIVDGDLIGVDWLSANPSSGIVPPGEADEVGVNFDAASLTAGLYEAIISIYSNDFTDPQVNVPVSLTITQEGAEPNIAVEPDSLVEELTQGDTAVQELTVSNTGTGLLNFEVEIVQDGSISFAEKVAMSKPFAAKASNQSGLVSPSYRRNTIPDQLIHGKKAFSDGITTLATNLYATDFEELSPGDIHGQDGWLAQYGNWTVSMENPAIGAQHLRGLSDGLGESLSISPTVGIGEEEYSSMSAMVDITGTGVSWSFAPQSPTAGLVVTRVNFNADGSASALVAEGETGTVVPITAAVPEGYFELGIEVNRSTSEFTVYFDGDLVFTGMGFAGDIENVAIISMMETAGPTLDIDNFSIFDGQLAVNEPFVWLSVDPAAGHLNPGVSTTLAVNFDATQLEPGGYSAEIHIYNNDPDDSLVVVPVRLNVGEETHPLIAVHPEFFKEKLKQDKTSAHSLTIENQGTAPLDYDIDLLDEGMLSFSEKVAVSNPFAKNAKTVRELKIPATRFSIPEHLMKGKTAYVAGINDLSSTLYATDFETFSEGDINEQQGWFGLYGNWTISSENAASDSLHVRGLSDGLGQSLAISPSVMIGEEEYSSMSAKIDLTGTGVSWNITPQSTTAGLVVTRVYFNEDGSASALIAEGEDGAIAPISAAVPEGYFELGIEVNRATFDFTVYFDEEVVFTGTGFAGDIENVAIVSDMEVAGPTLDVDDFAIYDGALDIEDPITWLSVNPEEGQIAPGATENLEVLFDATDMEPGVYGAKIAINSNDATNPSVVIPVQLTVKEDKLKARVFALLLINAENYHIMGTLEDGDVLDLAHLPTEKFNVVALTLPLKLGSVGFELEGDEVDVDRTDNHLPYSLFELHQKVRAKEGNYTLTVTPYEKKHGKGKRGEEMEVNFEVINSNANKQLLTVYPNPFAHEISVNIPSQFSGSVKVSFLDKRGNTRVLGTHRVSKDNRTFTYDMSRFNLRSGVDYYLRIEAVQPSKSNAFYSVRSPENERSSVKPEVIRIIKE